MDYKKIYTEDYFNGKSSFFYSLGYSNLAKFYFNNLFKPLRPFLQKKDRGRVLDIGCAYGIMLQKFPDSFEKFGIDVSEYAIAKAKTRLPNAKLKVAGAEDKLPFPENFFDIVICNDVIEHLENHQALLENVKKALKSDGILYINAPNLNWIRKKIFAYVDRKEHHISLMTHKSLFDLLNGAGFNVINHWTYTSLPYFFFINFRSNLGHESAFICKKI